nr:MYXO-CTERM sorting domain-containing protein [Pyxidicoccus fallax]
MGLATSASAERDVLGFPGTPRALEVWRPGVFSVAGSSVELYADPPDSLGENDAVGTFLSPANCFIAVKQLGEIVSKDNCRLPTRANIVPPHPNDDTTGVKRVKHTASGTGYAAVATTSSKLLLLTSPNGVLGDTPWTPLLRGSGQMEPTSALGVVEMDGGVPHALFGIASDPTTDLIWYRRDQEQARFSIPPTLSIRPPVTVDLFAGEEPYPTALVGNFDGLFRARLAPSGTTFEPVTVEPPEPVAILGVDVNTGKGDLRGEGFGLAVGLTPSEDLVVLGAVPADSAANAGTEWRVHRAFAGLNFPPAPTGNTEVSCVDSSYCVIALSRPDSSNVIIYNNAHAPEVEVDAGTPPLELDEGQTGSWFRASATDADLDAVRVSVQEVGEPKLSVITTAQPDALDVQVTALEVCKDEARVLTVYASDGLADHVRSANVNILVSNVRGTATPAAVTPASDSTVAGGASRVFRAVPVSPAPAGTGLCPTAGYRWTGRNGAPALDTSQTAGETGTATFTPPAVLCQPQGAVYTYDVEALDDLGASGKPSASTSFSVTVAPWGAPNAPFGEGEVRLLTSNANAGVDVVREARAHECIGTPGLPPVETVWRLREPGALPAGITVRDASGAAVSLDSPVVSHQLRVEAAACTRAPLTFVARNRIESAAGGVQEGPESTVLVSVEPPVEDVTAARMDLTATPTADGAVDVQLGTSLLCPAQYGPRARMSLRDTSGATLDEAVVDVPGTWRPTLPTTCSAREYVVRGELFTVDEGTGTQLNGGTAETRVLTEARQPVLGTLEGGALEARCGEGATATLTQTFPADACRDVSLSWSQVSGPALEDGALSGEQVTVSTRDAELEALVGASVVLRVTADAGSGKTASTDHEVPITVAPFVDVARESEPVVGAETGLAGVVARLRNTSACRVGTLVHRERVEGVEWVRGSVKLDGRPVVEREVEGGFEVEGIALEAGATGTLTYVIRPALLGSPRFAGEVFLNRVRVSGSIPEASTSSCGCSGGGSGAAAFGLLALARLLRRRRVGGQGGRAGGLPR